MRASTFDQPCRICKRSNTISPRPKRPNGSLKPDCIECSQRKTGALKKIPDRLLTYADVAHILNLSKQCVSDLVSSGKLQALKFSARSVRFRIGEIERYMKTLKPDQRSAASE